MKISWLEKDCFYLNIPAQKISILINPSPKRKKIKGDVVLYSSFLKNEKEDGDEAFIINKPGEYELKGVFIRGVGIKDKEGGLIIYTIRNKDISVCYLDKIKGKLLSSEIIEQLNGIDIIIAFLKEKQGFSVKELAKTVTQLEAKLVIPFWEERKIVERFLKELGMKKQREENQLSVKKKDLGLEGIEVVLLKPRFK